MGAALIKMFKFSKNAGDLNGFGSVILDKENFKACRPVVPGKEKVKSLQLPRLYCLLYIVKNVCANIELVPISAARGILQYL